MKFTNFQTFAKHVQDNSSKQALVPIYGILGKDIFIRKQAVDLLIKHLLPDPKQAELCLRTLESEQLIPAKLSEELQGWSLFAETRVLVIKEIEKLSKNLMKTLEEYLTNLNPRLYLILSGTSLNHSTNLYKKSEKLGVFLELEEEKEWVKEKSQTEWVITQVNSFGKKIGPQASLNLVKQAGTDSAMLYNEIQKLLCYIGERSEITTADIQAVGCHVNSANIWQLGEAIFQLEAANAMRISKVLLEDTVFLAWIRQLRHQFQTEFQICSILANNGTPADVTQLFPYMKNQILDRHIRMAQGYGLARFKRGMLKIDEFEVMAKNSAANNDMLAELLIFHLTKK